MALAYRKELRRVTILKVTKDNNIFQIKYNSYIIEFN